MKKIDKDLLKLLAIQLESELTACLTLSKDIANFSSNTAILSVIERAKKMEIENAEEIFGMRYWLFETDVGDYTNIQFNIMQNILARFQHALKCWRIEV